MQRRASSCHGAVKARVGHTSRQAVQLPQWSTSVWRSTQASSQRNVALTQLMSHWLAMQTGAAFALNAMIEADRVELTAGEPELVNTPSQSGKGQKIWRCPRCRVAVWSNYGGAGDRVRFVRVGTLDNPDAIPPDIHIFTQSKQPWVVLPEGARAVPEFYDVGKTWPKESLERRAAMRKG